MHSSNNHLTATSDYGNRSTDRVLARQSVENPEDAAVLLEAYRKKDISADSVCGSIATATLFAWLIDGTITQNEFDALVDAHSVQEIELGRNVAGEAPLESESEKIAGIRAKLASYPERTPVEALWPESVRDWSGDMEEGMGGIGVLLTFERKEADDDGPAASFTLELKVQPPGRDFSETLRAEAVFGWHPAFGEGVAYLVTVPLPIMKNGRRRLFRTVVESRTGNPLRLPQEVEAAFREKHIARFEILHAPVKAKSLIGMVSKAFGKAMGKS